MEENTMNHKIVRVSKTEIEMADGTIRPLPFQIDGDEVPSVEEFQAIYDQWLTVFQEKQLLEEHGSEAS
jgi:hypothetical protein